VASFESCNLSVVAAQHRQKIKLFSQCYCRRRKERKRVRQERSATKVS